MYMSLSLSVSLIYSLAVLFLIWSVYNFLGYRAKKREWRQKVGKWYTEGKRKSYIVVLGDRFDQTKTAEPLARKLQQANIFLTPSEYLGMHILGLLSLMVIFGSMFKIPFPINTFIPVGLLYFVHIMLFSLRKNKYEERFNNQLADICRLLGNAARSGMTINQGIDLVAKETSAPAGDEFKRISNEIKLGIPLETALRSVQKRNSSRDFQLFVATILIQKKTGGNLSAILESMAHTLEDRKVLNQTIKTMTAEQRYISFIVPLMPVILVLIMNGMIDGFIDPLWTGPGIVILVLFTIAIILSFFIIKKITNIRV
jgi:tight adherence protein B